MEGIKKSLFRTCVVSDNNPLDDIKSISNDTSREQRSFYHVDIDEVVKRMEVWRQLLPRVHPHYAVKCNDTPAVISTLALLGAGFDCASRMEIKKVLALGVSPSRIIYAHPCKIKSHLLYAKAHNVDYMTFDSIEELNKVAKLFPAAALVLRIRCDSASVQCELGVKFGAQPNEAPALLRHAAKLHLNVVGVAFHVGSGCSEPQAFHRAIAASRQVFREAEAEGFNMTLLDIGGGFLGGKDSTLDEAASCINEALDMNFPESMGVRVIAEPGRYFVSAAFTLATPIINKREISLKDSSEISNDSPLQAGLNDAEKSTMYFIDDGLYGSFNCVLYDHQVVKPVPLLEYPGGVSPSSVWGPTCDGIDRVIENMELPSALAVGDWLVWEEMGAYTLSAAGNFNGFPLPQVIVHMRSFTKMQLENAYEKQMGGVVSQYSSSEQSSGISSDDDASSQRSSSELEHEATNISKPMKLVQELVATLDMDKKRRTALVNLLFKDTSGEQVDKPLEGKTQLCSKRVGKSLKNSVVNLVDESESEEDRDM